MRTLICALLAGLALVAQAHAQPVVKIGYIRIEVVREQYQRAAAERSRVQAFKDAQQEKLSGLEKSFVAHKEAYDKQKDLITGEEAKKTALADMKTELQNLLKSKRQLEEELNKMFGQVTESLLKDIVEAVKAVALRDGYQMVLREEHLAYATPENDLTDAVVTLLNEKYTSNNPGAAGGAPR